MTHPFIRRFYRIDRADIGYLRFVVESYDGLLFLRTHNNREALVEMSYSPSRTRDAAPLLEALSAEMALVEVFPSAEDFPLL